MCHQSKECEKPENLKDTPENCSPEQVQQCHGGVQQHPCKPTDGCDYPEKRKGKPNECSPEQIRECHGDVSEHACEQD